MELKAISTGMVTDAVRHHLPNREITAIEDRGVWIRHNFKITLDGGDVVYLKLDQDFPASEKEAFIIDLLHNSGLPAPAVLALDTSRELLPASFIIQARVGGSRLGVLRENTSRSQQMAIYTALGTFYSRLHNIRHPHSGWIEGGGSVLPFSPGTHQYQEVIVRIGGEAVQRKCLSPESHQQLTRLWGEALPWLDQHTPSLISGPLHWTVYLEDAGGWRVTKLTDLHDMLYWDPAWDLASIRYPVFQPPLPEDLWQAFRAGYGRVPEDKRLRYYMFMQHLDAAMGNYMEPESAVHEAWKAHVWRTYDQLLNAAAG